MSSRFLAMAAAVIECWFADRACTISVSEIHKHIFIVFIFFFYFLFPFPDIAFPYKDRLMQNNIMHSALLALCYSVLFQPSKGPTA